MTRFVSRASAVALAWLLTGCESLTPVHTELADSGLGIPGAWQAPGIAGGVRQDWLDDFDDRRLPALVGEAVRNNHDLRAAAARVAQARAQARIAGAERLPDVGVGAAASRRGFDADPAGRVTADSFDAGVDIAWEIDLWGRIANFVRAAEYDAEAARADFAAARLSLAAAVARAWFDAVEAELQVALAEETTRNFRDNLEIVTEGFRAGLGSALDVRLERANLAIAESELAARRVTRDRAVRALEVLLGRYPAAELGVAEELPGLVNAVPAGLPAEILVRRPDVRAAALRLAASDERRNDARKNRLPSILLTASGGASSTELRNLLDVDALVWSIAGDLAAPVFQGGRLAGERDLARARGEEVLADYAQTVLVAFREVESALSAERRLVDQESALRVAVVESEEAAQLALERYRLGLVDIITWLEARRRAFNTKSSLLAVSNRRLQNRIELYLALGGDFALPGEAAAAAPAGMAAGLTAAAGAHGRRLP